MAQLFVFIMNWLDSVNKFRTWVLNLRGPSWMMRFRGQRIMDNCVN